MRRAKSLLYSVNYLESAILWNDGNSYSLTALPIEAQVSPIFGIIAMDLDEDGNMDIWLGGNFYSIKPQVGRHDASRGVLLKGDSKKNFSYHHQERTGIYVEGEVRDAAIIRSKQSVRFIISRNNSSALMFQKIKK
jgi:hypothetical protein